jgi:hypothetical protein
MCGRIAAEQSGSVGDRCVRRLARAHGDQLGPREAENVRLQSRAGACSIGVRAMGPLPCSASERSRQGAMENTGPSDDMTALGPSTNRARSA